MITAAVVRLATSIFPQNANDMLFRKPGSGRQTRRMTR
jgi:hypothetical protein